MPHFAAIDVGSNASRLLIVSADGPSSAKGSTVKVVHQQRVPVRMGHGVFVTGKLDPAAIRACSLAMKKFRSAMDRFDVESYRAVVTASARDADNSEELLEKVEATGIHLEAIEGTEEARVVKRAVEDAMQLHGKRALLCDLGGGSLEITEVNHDEVRSSTSLEIGSVRLLESFLQNGKAVKPAQEKLLLEYVDRLLQPVEPNLLKRSFDVVIGTGGNFDTVAELCPRNVPNDRGGITKGIDVRAARILLAKLKVLPTKERATRFNLRPDRADVIVPALYSMLAVADLARTDVIAAPGVGLKEGLIAELVDAHFLVRDWHKTEQVAMRSAMLLGRRYNFDEQHATQVDRLAMQIFDQTKVLHRLPDEDRLLLRAAALLHDVGDFVHVASHHKHTQYIIEHSDVMGLSAELRILVALIARYHRRAAPSDKHAAFKALDDANKRRVRKMSSLLRLADALDRGHRSKINELEIKVSPQEVRIHVSGREDVSLETWTVTRKSALFGKTFRKKIRVLS